MTRISKRIARLAAVIIVSGGLLVSTAVSADNVTTTLTVLPGVLTEVAVDVTATSVTPGSAATYTMPITATDTRGTGVGWNLTITSTPFQPVSGAKFPDTASMITAASSACAPTCTLPTNAITYPLALPASATPPTAVKFFNAAATTGTGVMTVTPTVSVAVPLTASSVAYISTITLSIVSAP